MAIAFRRRACRCRPQSPPLPELLPCQSSPKGRNGGRRGLHPRNWRPVGNKHGHLRRFAPKGQGWSRVVKHYRCIKPKPAKNIIFYWMFVCIIIKNMTWTRHLSYFLGVFSSLPLEATFVHNPQQVQRPSLSILPESILSQTPAYKTFINTCWCKAFQMQVSIKQFWFWSSSAWTFFYNNVWLQFTVDFE